MSSDASREPLIVAQGIRKAFPRFDAAPSVFWRALLGRKTPDQDLIEVLHGIDLTIGRGESVGILGRNGAGKTTLLSILGGVAEPTSGTVNRNGKIATLLALTAGFHPNLTGRENARLFCAMHGLSNEKTRQALVGIETFAAIGQYFDMPLRTYSSGMQARVAFASAVHIDADLIIVDETLAVGDAAFRMKCYERLRQMREAGQTFLLVSHSQNVVASFCTRGVVLEQGRKVFDGPTLQAVDEYKRLRTEFSDAETVAVQGGALQSPINSGRFKLVNVDFVVDQRNVANDRLLIKVVLQANSPAQNVVLNFGLRNHEGIAINAFDGRDVGPCLSKIDRDESITFVLSIDDRLLGGRYFLSMLVGERVGDDVRPLALFQNVWQFDRTRVPSSSSGIIDLRPSVELFKSQTSLEIGNE